MLKIDRRLAKIYQNFYKDFQKNIKFYFAYNSIGDYYDPREDNYTKKNLNPIVIKGIVREIDAEKLVWKSYGLERMGTVEVLIDKKYKNWFKIVNKIEIDSQEYEVYSTGTGGNSIIQERPFGLIRAVLSKRN